MDIFDYRKYNSNYSNQPTAYDRYTYEMSNRKKIREEEERLKRSQQPTFAKKRIGIMEGLDLLNIFNYTIAGGLTEGINSWKNATSDGYSIFDPLRTFGGFSKGVAKGAAQGLTILPGWEGFNTNKKANGAYSFTDVQDSLGWKKEANPDGKWYNPLTWSPNNVAHTITGLGLDIATDPTTYLTGGLSGIVKGSGKVLVKEGAEVAAREAAEKVVKASLLKQGVREVPEVILKKHTDDFMKHYTDLTQTAKAGDVKFGFENAPLIGRWLKNKGLINDARVLVNAETMQKAADRTIIPHLINNMKASFLDNPYSKAISKKAGLYEFAKKDPETLFNMLGALDAAKLIDYRVLRSQEFLDDFVKEYAIGLNYAQHQQIIKSLKDPYIMKQIEKISTSAIPTSMRQDFFNNLKKSFNTDAYFGKGVALKDFDSPGGAAYALHSFMKRAQYVVNDSIQGNWIRDVHKTIGEDVLDTGAKKGFKKTITDSDLNNYIERVIEESDIKLSRADVLESLGLDSGSNKWYKPLIEVSDEQAKLMRGKLDVRNMNPFMLEEVNKARNLQIQSESNNFLKAYDVFLKQWKKLNTIANPNWHTSNVVGNNFINWISVGSDVLDPSIQKYSSRLVRDIFNNTKTGDAPQQIIKGLNMSYDQIKEAAIKWGVVNNTLVDDIVGNIKQTRKKATNRSFKDSINIFNDDNVFTDSAKFLEGRDRMAHFIGQLKKGKSPKEAAKSVNKWLFDYGDLTQFEHTYMKRIIPFYAWTRKNLPLQTELLIEKPNIFRNLSKVQRAIESNISDDDRVEKPNWADDFMQLPGRTKDGKATLFNNKLAYSDLGLYDLGNLNQNITNMLTPLLKDSMGGNVDNGGSTLGVRPIKDISSAANREGSAKVYKILNMLGVPGTLSVVGKSNIEEDDDDKFKKYMRDRYIR